MTYDELFSVYIVSARILKYDHTIDVFADGNVSIDNGCM